MTAVLDWLAPFHFVGGGGIGMSAIARILLERGWEVSASDNLADPRTIGALEALGARTTIGYRPEAVPARGTIVQSSAIRADNPEIQEAERRGLPVLHRAQLLALIARGTPTIAVTGTHGKSTTTAMIAHILVETGGDPTAIIGADMLGWNGNARTGSGWTVLEADESDGSLCWYAPEVAVITTIDSDHLDHYRDLDEILATMAAFAGQVAPGGVLIACVDDAGVRRLLEAPPACRVVTYGERGQLVVDRSGALSRNGITLAIELSLPGGHQRANAAAAILAAIEAGVDAEDAARALSSFRGTGRRFEHKGIADEVTVIDDYAHHPTEVAASLRAAREISSGRVLAIFEPHLYSRTRDAGAAIGAALAVADHAAVLPIYAAREDPIQGVSHQFVVEGAAGQGDVVALATYDDAVAWATKHARPGDLVLTLGAGSVTSLGPMILEAMEAR